MDNKTLARFAEPLRPCRYDAGGEAIVSAAAAGLRGTCATIRTERRSRIANTFPVWTPAIPQHPQCTHSHSPVGTSVTLGELHIGHFNEVSMEIPW